MPLERILVLDDEPLIQKSLGAILERRKYSVTIAGTIAEAEALVARETFDLCVCDVRLPDGDGQQFLERLMVQPERPLVVMVTGHGTIEHAVQCIRLGAFDYLIKPFSPSQIEVVLNKAESYRQLLSVNRFLSDQDSSQPEGTLLGRSPALQRLRQLITRVAPTDATVLIAGENGTGKEMVARELYRYSSRRNEPYIKVNCAALSETLIESEIFGHEKGAFTGATERREGRFELANRGTLLLDEVSEIPPGLQAKLLRVLQEREFERVGGTKTIKVNVRILATSNRNLLQSVERGEFRSDLYYRLNVFPVEVPPLRERPDDIVFLGDAFLQRFARKHRVKTPGFSDQARAALLAYPWPGNVRELQNTIERAVILAEDDRPVTSAHLGLPNLARSFRATEGGDRTNLQPRPRGAPPPEASPLSPPLQSTDAGRIDPPPTDGAIEGLHANSRFLEEGPRDEPPPPSPAPEPPPPPPPAPTPQPEAPEEAPPPQRHLTMEELEKIAILDALRRHGGNRVAAAAELDIAERTIRNKLAKYREKGDVIPGDANPSDDLA